MNEFWKRRYRQVVRTIVALGILASALAFIVPAFVASRKKLCRDACIRNLQIIKADKQQWDSERSMTGRKLNE